MFYFTCNHGIRPKQWFCLVIIGPLQFNQIHIPKLRALSGEATQSTESSVKTFRPSGLRSGPCWGAYRHLAGGEGQRDPPNPALGIQPQFLALRISHLLPKSSFPSNALRWDTTLSLSVTCLFLSSFVLHSVVC